MSFTDIFIPALLEQFEVKRLEVTPHWALGFDVPSPCLYPPPSNPPKGLTASLVLLHMVLQWCWITLAQPVDVQYGQQIIQLVVGSEGHGLPHGPLGHLSIPQQAEHTVAAEE